MNEEIQIISSSSECSIRMFMSCAFGKDLKSLIISGEPAEEELNAAWLNIYTEFVDLSGLAQTQEFEIMKTIFYLDSRVKRIKLLIFIQNESIEKLGQPCIGAFAKLDMYGHRLMWDKDHPDLEAFKQRILSIESTEKRYEIELNGKIKELMNLKKKQQNQELPEMQKRKEFIRSLNNLERAGFRIDRDKTTVEDLALMIGEMNDQAEKKEYSNTNQ